MLNKDIAMDSDPCRAILEDASFRLDELLFNYVSAHTPISPIERLFRGALALQFITRIEGFSIIDGKNNVSINEFKKDVLEHKPNDIVIGEQIKLGYWPIDFVLYSSEQFLAIECDGHKFHELTKEQAARDRGRDRRLQILGIKIFRFTGSELWKDPVQCATEAYEWATGLQFDKMLADWRREEDALINK